MSSSQPIIGVPKRTHLLRPPKLVLEGALYGAPGGGGGRFLSKMPGEGRGSPGGGGAGVCGELGNGGGGLNFFFRGRNVHQVTLKVKNNLQN